jgi:hypothetical protein
MASRFKLCAALLALLTLSFSFVAHSEVVPITRVHAHNDYEHARPLFAALDEGFCSVEADINLVNGKLLVAHSLKATDPHKTLESLYLDPLRKRIRQNGGSVYPSAPKFYLLIDFKTAAEPTYAALRKVLKKYSNILTVYHHGKKQTRAITVVLTGNYPRATLAAETVRYAAGDGKLPDLQSNPPASLVPWISENWAPLFKWRGHGEMPPDELAKLQNILKEAHDQGRLVRFWNAPDQPGFWKAMLDQGVDLINTDDLKGFKKFYAGE